MRLRYFVSLLTALFIVLQLNAQKTDYHSQWKEINSLNEKGLYDQALKHTKSLFVTAQKEENSVQMVKALIHQFNYSQQFEEDAVVKSIQELEAVKKQVKGVERALLGAALSDLYLFYYQNNSWEINKRQDIAGTRPSDMAFWTKEHFKTEIENLLDESLSQEKVLKETSSEYWQEIFVKDSLGFEVFPTLYDFVAWKAIGFYASYEFRNAAEEDLLVLNDPGFFGDYQEFLRVDFSEYDAAYYKVKTLQIYQNLIKTHQGRKTPLPLLYTDVKRLNYINEQGQIDGKEEKFVNALQSLYKQYKFQNGVEFVAQNLINKWAEGDENQRTKALNICNEIIQNKKETEYFQYRKEMLLQKNSSLSFNGVLLPNNPSISKLSFKNVNHVWFRIYRIEDDFLQRNTSEEKMLKTLLSQEQVSEFDLKVSEDARLIERTAAIDLPSMDYGKYAIIVSSGPEFLFKDDFVSAHFFWVSRFQLIENNGRAKFLLVDRETGEPIANAKVDVYTREWEYTSRSHIEKKLISTQTDENGSFAVKDFKSRSVSLHIRKGQDEWKSRNIYINDYKSTKRTDEKHDFFTDRAIYRPGQTVYFKGIFTEKTDNVNKVLAHKTKEIKLYGANGKVLQSLELTSNEFGSVSGSFVLPMSGLNGNYRISSDKSRVYFKVEEYKRPKFEVVLDNPEKEYKINETITINGNADYYAGTGLQNAEVKYQVKRSVYSPWGRYYWWPVTDELAITAGKTKTNEKGSFEISFIAKAPEFDGVNPWYNYQVMAEVTDETGETHSKTLHIMLGKTSMNISTTLPEIMDVTNPIDVMVSAKTPNGKKLYPEIIFKLEKLRAPKELLKTIDFEFDTLLISQKKISQEFVDYSFAPQINQSDAIVLEKKMDTRIDSIIPKSIFKSLSIGNYKMSLSSFDKDGNPVIDTADFMVFSSKKDRLAEPQEFFSFTNQTSIEVGDTFKFSYGSSFKDAQFYYEFSSKPDQDIQSHWIDKPKELNHIQIPITEELRGGFSIQILMQKNNEFYQFHQNIEVPFTNKKLDVQLSSFRNPMSPGAKEQWKLTIKNSMGDIESAEVLAAMYDASLDVFDKNSWNMWPYSMNHSHIYWRNSRSNQHSFSLSQKPTAYYSFLDPQNLDFDWNIYQNHQYDVLYSKSAMPSAGRANLVVVEDDVEIQEVALSEQEETTDRNVSEPELKEPENIAVSPRKNLNETAFFYPQLTTDKDGNVELNFTSPEALTRWKLMVLAHTKDMKIGQLTKEVTTQKQLMVMPNLPRFLRGGDEIAISTKVLNLLEEAQQVKARLVILDAATKEELNLFVAGQDMEQSLSISASGQAEVNWKIQVPEKIGAVIIRITAQGEKHSDGEEHILPVLSQLHFLTDTYPFTLSTQNTINARDLQLREEERTRDDELTLEIVSNPLWYVVQAIPNYQPPQKANALNWMNYFYVQSMAAYIVKENPEIEEVFKQWQMLSPEELESELFQNPELKKVMIEETPWLLNAESQSQRKQEIARLFDENNLNMQLESAVKKLSEMQKPNGGFGWIDGMKTSPWISAQIASSLGQLLEAGILDLDNDYKSRNIIKKLVKYIDDELEIAYQKAQKEPKKYHSTQSNLLTARSYFLEIHPLKKGNPAYDFFLNKWKEKKNQKSLSEKMRLARVLWKSDQKEEAKELMAAIKDIALTDEHGGIYWRDFQRYESVSQQAEMIALFELTEQESRWQEGMKLWLLQQKRANDWGNGTSTSRACLVMLSDAPKLSASPKVYITMNGEEQLIGGNAGTGYFKITWNGTEIDKTLEDLQIRKEGDGMIFGAFYDQYFEKMSEIETHDGGVSIQKQLFVTKTQGEEQVLLPLKEGAQIELGDRILIRMTLDNKQAMDFVHLRDYIPAGFENKNPLSGYRWQGSVSYYQSPGDVATDYYLQHLPKGKFVIEYKLNATISGTLNSGPAEIQSLYAPEFGGHSSGEMIDVVK